MSDLKEIEMLVNFLKKRMLSKTVLMHCVSLYPTPLKKINLNFIQTLKKSSSFPLDFQIIQLEQRQWRSPYQWV